MHRHMRKEDHSGEPFSTATALSIKTATLALVTTLVDVSHGRVVTVSEMGTWDNLEEVDRTNREA